MGFDTRLEIDGHIALMWRKQWSSLPRLLFRHEQCQVHQFDPHDDDHYALGVELTASASEVLETLETAGLGWEATIAAYAQVRQGVVAESLLWVEEVFRDGLSRRDHAAEVRAAKRREAFRAQAPRHDLEALGKLLARQWMDETVDEVLIFKDIIYEQPIEVWYSFISNIIDECLKYEDLDAYAAGRATESWALLYREAPLLAWPMLICILLQHLPGTATVTYVLTEDAHESSVSTVDEAWKYLDDYWEGASEGLATQAEILGRLFGVLAGFDSKLGRHFWFARATEAFGRLNKLNGQPDEVSTKARGDALESLVDALLRTEEPELQVVAKNFRTTEEEIDVVLTNGLTNPFWTSQASPLILVECKNWTSKVGVRELRVFESKMQDRGAIAKIGIFVSMSGFTAPFMERLKVIQGHGGVIFAVSGPDLLDVITTKTRLTDWLRSEGVLRALGK